MTLLPDDRARFAPNELNAALSERRTPIVLDPYGDRALIEALLQLIAPPDRDSEEVAS